MGLFSFRDDFKIASQPQAPKANDNGVVQGIVKNVYLDFGFKPGGTSIIPGTIEVSVLGREFQSILTAFPQNEQFLDVPLIGEVVDVFYYGSITTYRRINVNNTINNAESGRRLEGNQPSTGLGSFKSLGSFIQKAASFAGVLGKYFTKKPIHRLRLYEGDTLIQSKFGQSIRLSGYNNKGNNFSPTIVIRNKENEELELVPLSLSVEENINKDGTTILLSSGDKNNIPFQPGKVDKLGVSNFSNRPDKVGLLFSNSKNDFAFEDYPTSYTGDQCIITSDRLIFSSRKNETIFWSKGNYGIITDSTFSIDAEKGININSKKEGIDIQAFDQIVNFYLGDTGEIRLGTKGVLKPAVDGTLLIEILGKIIAEIINLRGGGLLTPAGPVSGMDPTRDEKLREIADKVEFLASKSVKIQM